jgi:hypothetical protein
VLNGKIGIMLASHIAVSITVCILLLYNYDTQCTDIKATSKLTVPPSKVHFNFYFSAFFVAVVRQPDLPFLHTQ